MDMQVITSDSLIPIDQHFKVSAGPGAGKTKFLVNHIKNVLYSSQRLGRSRKIACITYTNVGVETIIQRLGNEIDHVEVSTIHSFLYTHIVKPYLFLISDKYDLDPAKIDSPYEHIVSSGYFNKTDLSRKNITESDMKKIYWEINGDTCKLKLKGRRVDNHDRLLKYKKFFWEKGIIHYEDVLAFSWEILKVSEDILRIIRSKFPYFFIDEFQDTNPIQTEIIKLIASKETTVGVIGDKAQSIYEFQGADVKQFNEFVLPQINQYKMEDNHRSTGSIITVLNTIRKDIEQQSPNKKIGKKPTILVGDTLGTLQYIKGSLGIDSVTSLSYSNLTANAIRNNLPVEPGSKWQIIDEMFEDSSTERRKLFVSLIKAIEYAKLSHFKDAIKELSRHFIKHDAYKGHRLALIILKTMLNSYHEYQNESLWVLYEKVLNLNVVNIIKIRENKKTPSKVESYYKETIYSNIALHVKIAEDDSQHRTIHKAKGSEFDNVLLIVKGKDGNKYKEERELGFLLNPDIDNNEDHRVHYVACSRARKNLFINVPELSGEAESRLRNIFDIIQV
ncbi:MAG: ATP-dependent helicase [Paenibacillus dendritiformis]|uniref:UvrD-helicase domain-containing protein n=1 Tax=uncultured Paenibacillus sp. TaxID=227322 RepID=UPI0025E20814|nr:ATP-dependent helicase [uncultured Paenibacillus sp.]MDU5145427.1 ATP-dependent helicase [Paenibacillus dendritiformis]